MNSLVLVQLLVSFLVGGMFVAVQSLIAERVSPTTAGIILTLPSTLGISFIFISLALSPQAIGDIVPLIPLTFGISLLFVVTYVYASPLFHSKSTSMILCSLLATAVWLALTIPLAIYRFSSLPLSLLGFGVLAVIAHDFLRRGKQQGEAPAKHQYTLLEIGIRSCAAGTLIAVVVLLSKTLGHFWGGHLQRVPRGQSFGAADSACAS